MVRTKIEGERHIFKVKGQKAKITILISYCFWTGPFQNDSPIEPSLMISHKITCPDGSLKK